MNGPTRARPVPLLLVPCLALAILWTPGPVPAADGPRQLGEQDMARIRERMAAGRELRQQQAAEAEVRRQELERQRAEDARLAEMEAAAEAEWEAMQVQHPPQASGGFAGALLHGMNVLQDEMARHEVERARQQAFLDDVRRQAEAVAWQRERGIERERQRVAEERARREHAARQQRVASGPVAAVAGTPAGSAATPATPATGQPSQAQARDQVLREQAAAERERQRQRQAAQQAAAQADGERRREEAEAERKRDAEARRLADEQARQQKEQAWRDHLAAHARGIRLGARSCDGKDRPYRLVGNRPPNPLPAAISHYSSCISVRYEARCPGTQRGGGLQGTQYNFTGMGLGCLSAESPFPGQLACPAEQVQVEVLDVTGCS